MPLWNPVLTPPIPTGYSVTGGTPSKTLTSGSLTTTTILNFLQQLVADLESRTVIGS